MRLSQLLLAVVLSIATTLGLVSPSKNILRLRERSERQIANNGRFVASINDTAPHIEPRARINVDTYVHIVTSSFASKMSMTRPKIERQIKILNDTFALAGVSFSLLTVDYWDNADWAKDLKFYQKKIRTRRGGKTALNLYFQEDLKALPWMLGRCTSPSDFRYNEVKTLFRDGCEIKNDALDFADTEGEELGLYTVANLVGGWLGLSDVFCDGRVRKPMYDLKCKPAKTNQQIADIMNAWYTYRADPKDVLKPIKAQCLHNLPYYDSPDNPIQEYLQCVPHEGHVKELRENYCGTRTWCQQRLWERISGGQKYKNWKACIYERKGRSDM